MKNFNLIEMLQGCSKRNGTTFRQSNPDGQTTVNRQSRLMLHQGYLKNFAMLFAVLVMSIANIGMAWGEDVTWNITEANVTTLTATQGASITIGSGSKQYSVHAVRGGGSNKNSDSWVADVGMKFGDGNLYKSGIAVYVPTTSNNISSISFYMKKSADKARVVKYYAADAIALESEPSTSTQTLTTSFAPYSPFSSPAKGKYYIVGGYTGGSGDVYLQKVVVTFSDAPAGSGWGIAGSMNSWTASNNEMTGSGTVSTTISLSANTQYDFKVVDMNTSTWHTNTGTIKGSVTNLDFSTTGGTDNNCHIRTSCAGTYTFTYNTSTNKLSVTYPESHKVYFTKDGASWSKVYAYCFNGDGWDNGWPGYEITSNTEDHCGTEYYAYTDGYTYIIFNNGSGGVGNQTGDITVAGYEGQHAVGAAATGWTAYPTYTVTYDGNEKTGGSVPMDGNSPYACSSTVTVLGNTGSLERTGYNFVGWNTAANGSGTDYIAGNTFTISANTTLYAKWEAVKYTVTYDVNGGGSVTPTSATQASSGASLTLPTPTWSGYTFDGWYSAGAKIGNGGASYTPTADITLYAHWTDNISGKVFSFIDNNYGDKFKGFDGTTWVSSNATGKSKTYTNGDGVQYVVSAGAWDKKDNAISALAKLVKGTTSMSIVIPSGKIATVKISYNAYGTGDDYRLTVNDVAQANPTTKLADGNTNAQVVANMKEITLSSQTGTLALSVSGSKNDYIGRVSAVITGYTVTYAKGSADGATGDSFTGTRTAGSSFTLSSSSSAFTRSGYVYDGWSVNANGSTKDYNLGGSYTTDAAITLYPHWVADCVAPTEVNISGTYHYFPGETISLTAAAEGGSGTPTTYQWYKGGTADGNIIEGATSATYSKAKCTYADAGSYYCKVTRGGSCSKFSDNYDVKILHLYVNTGRNGTPFGDVDFVKVGATTARATISLGANWDYGFNIADGCGHYYGNSGSMNESNCTGWTMNVDGTDCLMRTTNGATYTFTVDYTTLTAPVVSITYPSANQAVDKVIYFDNSARNWSTLHYRIGRTNHTQATAMTQVPGTANLYKVTTAAYNNFSGWHIANNAGWTGDNNSIYRTNTNDDQYSITYATAHEGGAVTDAAITVTPTTSRGMGGDKDLNDNCEFYNYEITTGMKTQNVSITAPSNGTIRVAYTDVAGESQSFTSGNRDLAHTVIITPTATPAEGYTLSGLTVNGDAHTSGTTYTVTANTTIAATFSPASYTVTLNTNGGTINAGDVTSYTYGTGATLPTNVTKSGFTFGGWYDNSGLTGSAVTTISTTATGNKEYWAKWTATAGDCHKYFYYGALSAPSPAPTKNENSFFSNIPSSGSSLSESWEIDGVTYTTSNRCGNSSNIGTFTVPSGKVATMYVMFNGGSSYTMTIKKGGSNYKTGIDASSGIKKYTEEDMGPGTYAVTTSGNVGLLLLIVDVCDDGPDVTAPTFVSSVPANGATDVATSGTIVLTFSEALGSVDPSKFTLTGATKGTVTIDGSDAAKVNITYTGAENSSTVTLATDAAAVSDLAGNALAAELSDISFTTAAAAPAGDCITIAYFETSQHSNSSNKPDKAGKYLYGYTNSAKTEAYAYTITTGSTNNKGQGTGASDYLRVDYGSTINVYADNTTTGGTPANFSNVTSVSVDFKMNKSSYYTTFDIFVGSTKIANNVSLEGAAQSAFTTFTYNNLEQLNGKISIVNKGSSSTNFNFHIDNIQICTSSLTPCTTPVIPTLSNQTVCPGSDIAAWDATQTAVLADGETASYSWKKKGNDTELANTATFDLGSSAAESQAGTYVVTVTVSKAGKASATATKEVTLTVTAAVEEPVITANKATVYPGNSVTLTATCGTDGVTWNWYLCANADGTGAGSSLGTSSSYTIASAGAAGTYYYKAVATGDGTHSCGAAEYVYTLTVTAASECEKYFWFVYAADAASNGVVNNRDNFFGSSPKTGSSNSSTYKFTLDGTEYTATRNTGDNTFYISFTVPEGSTATLALNCKGSSSKPIYLIPTSGDPVLITDNSSNAAHVVENIAAGTYKVGAKTDASASWTLAGMAVQVCTASSCTDATPTITAANTTVCVGSELSISSTGYETGATFQWQKLNNSTSTWDNISGATSATYTVTTAAAEHAGSYRLVATKGCARTSNTVTISVPSAPNFGSTVPASVSIMQTIALSINTVEATDAVKYKWYKSADATWDAGDTEIGTSKELIKAYDGEAIGNPSYYIFCRAQNACGITTSTAIAVNVTEYVEEDCATKGNEDDAEFGFENTGCSQGTYSETAVWTTNSRSKYLTYTAPEGKYLKTAKVTVAVSSGSKCGYAYSTDGGTTWTYAELASLSSTLTEKTINLNSLSGTINAFRISRNLQDGGGTDHGVTSGNFYLSKACFEYTDACTATTVTVNPTSKTYTIGNSWTAPTITLGPVAVASETLTYTSSDEDIATVDDDGTVNFQGRAGSVTITASYAGGEVGLTDYCASEGSYTITVSCSGDAPKIVEASTVDLSGCNSSVVLNAKEQDGTTDFTGGSYQWLRNGEEIDGATNKSYTATQAGIYTVEYTSAGGCTSVSTNSAVVTSETTEPEVERLVPFQYYHVNKTYSDQMKMRHLFAVKNSGTLEGKHFKMYVSRNGAAATDVTSSNALVVVPNGDGHVDTVMVDLNKLSGKYSENDELVFTCKAINCDGNVSEVYKNTITMNVIGATPTLALICSGSSKAGGTRKESELTVGGDFLTGYNKADLCEQTGKESFNANTEWGLYTRLKENYTVTPVNGYAVFNKLNYEPFDILLLTDYPKASKSDAAATVLDDMAALCDYRPMLSFKTHMVKKSPSKWAAKGFTTSPVVTKGDGKLNLNIVCYAHPMFASLKTGDDVYTDVGNTSAPLVYTMLSGTGYEGSKGMQGFELAAAENFITIGLTHYNATITKDSPNDGEVEWTPGTEDRMLVTVAERQANPEARFILFSLNIGAHSKLTEKGEDVVLACLNYLLGTAEGTIEPADCSFTFDNGENNEHDASWYASNCPSCTGTKGDGKWTTAANWGPDYRLLPGEFTSVRIKKPVEVNDEHAHVMEVRVIDEGSIDIPANKALDVKSTIRRMDGSEIYPTEENDIHVGSASTGNGTLIFNNDEGDTKARVDMYSKGYIDGEGVKNYQYIGTPFVEINALYNYYGSWIYSWGTKKNGNLGWVVVKNGGPMTAWTGYCITQEAPTYHQMSGTLTATGTVDITVPANANMVVGNSWTAPIDINALTTDDLEGLTANIYFFNTGVDKTGTAGAAGSRYAGSTYVTVPINSAPYTEDDHIPSLQGFFVKNTGGSAGTLHLDYERHVRKTTRNNILSDEMHAPARRTAFSSDEPVVLKMKVSGENYDDKLLLLEREDFTEGFDNGWDGDKWDGNESALYIYTTDNNGTENSVSAIPELEGTIIGFRAGEDDAYTLNFEYLNSDEPLYLYDVENNTYTQIMTGMTYRFFTTDNEKHERFIITRSNGQEVATGVEPVSGSLDRSKAKKLLIEDKMFIMVNGMLYDATGKVVK